MKWMESPWRMILSPLLLLPAPPWGWEKKKGEPHYGGRASYGFAKDCYTRTGLWSCL